MLRFNWEYVNVSLETVRAFGAYVWVRTKNLKNEL